MNKDEEKFFIQDLEHEKEIYKWMESERAGKDLGKKALDDWEENYKESYIKFWHEMNDNYN